mgnify:CR=1 FL=1
MKRTAKKFWKRISAALMAVMMIVTFLPASVSAAEGGRIEKTSRLPYGYDFTGIYSNVPAKYKGHSMTANEVERWTFITADGARHPAYCIEFGNNNFTPGGSVSSSTTFDKLNRTQQRYATYALMYGYDGTTKWGYSADAEYYATQVMMWAIADNVFNNSTYESDFVNGFSTDWITGTYHREIGDIYYKIKSEILNHNKIPSFAKLSSLTAPTVTLNYNASTGYYETTLTDTNNILASFTFEFGSDVKVTRSGNTLKLQTKSVIQNPRTASTYKSATLQNPNAKIVWWELLEDKCGADQVKVHAHNQIDPVRAYVKIKTNSLSKAHIVKTSDDGNVSGIKIRISNSALGYNKTFVTDSKGEINATDLIDGYKYTATEMEVPSQYIQPQSQTFTASIAKTVELKFHNTLKKGWAQIRKEDSKTGKQIPGGVYGLYNAQGELMESVTTKAEDYARTEKQYPYGTYYWQEITPPPGYSLNPEKYPVAITEDGQTVSVTATDDAQLVQIEILKQGEVLSNFDFRMTEFGKVYAPIYEIRNLGGAAFEMVALTDIVSPDGTLWYHAGDLIDTQITGEDGSPAVFKPLRSLSGKVLIREKEAPYGYFLGSNEFEVELGYDSPEVQQFTVQVDAENSRQKYKLRFAKTIEENEVYPNPEAYQDIIFGVRTKAPVLNADGAEVLGADELVDVIGLDSSFNGISNTDYWEGADLYLQELQTAEGYNLNPEKYDFGFEYTEQTIPLVWKDLNETYNEILNTVIRGQVELYKRSSFDGKLLPNAHYDIYDLNGNYIETLVTDQKGHAISSMLPYGDYILKEMIAPDRYHLEPTEYPFSISEQGQVITFDMEDEPKIGMITADYTEKGHDEAIGIPTGDPSHLALTVSLSLLSLSGIGILLFKRRSRK